MNSNDRIVFNTIVTYISSIISIFILLYVTRTVLENLGSKDFGLNNVIAGVVSMLSFLGAAMATSTQRYISHAIGAKQQDRVKSIYTNSFIIHIVIAIALAIIFEIIGLYLVNYKLNIDSNRFFAANCLLQFTIISTFFTIIAVPNDAAINAKENLSFLAILGIFEVILRLITAVSLAFISWDKLIFFGFCMMLISIVLRGVKWWHVKSHYHEFEVNIKKYYNKILIKEMYSFAGWNFFGALSVVGKNEGFAIAINIFFGTVVNAAFAVSNQVSGQLLFFSRTLLKAINPQIVKNEGAGDRSAMVKLAYSASKFGFLLVGFVAVPFMFEMENILDVWLINVPEYSTLFCQFMVLSLLIGQLTIGLQTAVQATGFVKIYQLVVGSIQLLNVPVYFILFYFGYPPYWAVMAYCFFEFMACVARFIILRNLIEIKLIDFINDVTLPQLIPTIISTVVCMIMVNVFDFQYRFIVTLAIAISIFMFIAYKFSLTANERNYIKKTVDKLKNKMKTSLN
ncbi:MATE family efflux transporter [Flavobacterium piscis]|uniref:Na+-driven multidrug efflux pump n=1 Tax=Flavobacterium piscis TaxID=1114874 RepID=A0ABU1Y8W4_9FLAO|nr:MATE family efflux transporter [Flavobacterium piscis]MDR7210677.1 Na+-driven multidrug efflux pump [Flavobacterium piscis]